jgi:hypothetical protein
MQSSSVLARNSSGNATNQELAGRCWGRLLVAKRFINSYVYVVSSVEKLHELGKSSIRVTRTKRAMASAYCDPATATPIGDAPLVANGEPVTCVSSPVLLLIEAAATEAPRFNAV